MKVFAIDPGEVTGYAVVSKLADGTFLVEEADHLDKEYISRLEGVLDRHPDIDDIVVEEVPYRVGTNLGIILEGVCNYVARKFPGHIKVKAGLWMGTPAKRWKCNVAKGVHLIVHSRDASRMGYWYLNFYAGKEVPDAKQGK